MMKLPAVTSTTQFKSSLRASASISALLLFLVALPSISQDVFWRDSRGARAPETAFRSSVNGVGGWLLITPDDDWESKWNTPSETVPQFTEAHTLAVGKHLHILTLIGNPGRSTDGTAHVTCDFSIQRPDGTYDVQKQDVECLTGALTGGERTIYLSRLVIGFAGEKGDPAGQWAVRVTVKDLVKHTTIPLETTFLLQ